MKNFSSIYSLKDFNRRGASVGWCCCERSCMRNLHSLFLSLDFNMVRHWSISDSSRFARKTTATTKVNIKIQFLCNFRASEQHRSNKWIGHLVYTVKVDSALKLDFCNVFYFVSYVSTDFTVHGLYPQQNLFIQISESKTEQSKYMDDACVWMSSVSSFILCCVLTFRLPTITFYRLNLQSACRYKKKYGGRERQMA